MPDIIATGELLIDFVCPDPDTALVDAVTFRKAAGGAPANVAAGVSRLGLSSGFMGMVGEDDFGLFLRRTLDENGVDTSRLRFTERARTALAFVSLRAGGERDFVFYRNPSADMLYSPADVDADYIRDANVLHFGSISLGARQSRAATLRALEIAAEGGLLVSYDPNLRLNLWRSERAARAGMLLGWPYADLIKVSEEELRFLSGKDDLEAAARSLWHDRLRLLVVTLGAHGSLYFTKTSRGEAAPFKVDAVDATGAGDAFFAGLLYSLSPYLDPMLHGDALPDEVLDEALRFANAAGALTTTRHGAIPALPRLDEVRALLSAGQ